MKTNIAFWAIFGLIILSAIWIHVLVPHDDLVRGDGVVFSSVDDYYHMMGADYTYENWPSVKRFEPLMTYPQGDNVGQRPLNAWMIATIAKFGHIPLNIAGAYWPVFLCLLTIISVFFIGWVAWNKWAGLISAALLATIYGEFLGRVSLATPDQHAFETFGVTATILFFILALKKHWAWAIGAGILLSMYVMNWAGAPLLILILLVYLVVMGVWNQYRGESNRPLCIVTFIPLYIACIIFAVFRREEMTYMLFYIVASVAPLIIFVLSKLMGKLKPFWYIVGLFGVIVICGGVLYAIFPMYVKYASYELMGLVGSVGSSATSLGRTISEAQPLFAPYGNFTLALVWGGYGIVFFAGLIGAILLIFHMNKDRYVSLLVMVWFLFMFIVTAMQRRFGYYFAVNVCLLTGYLCWFIVDKFGHRKLSRHEAKHKGLPKHSMVIVSKPIIVGMVFVIMASMILPNIALSKREASVHPYAITPAWQDACEWLKTETPDTQDYGVVSWWDYGYWILREGKRAVACHPGGGNSDKSAKFFIAQSTEEANQYADLLEARYIVIDYLMATYKFYAMPMVAGIEKYTDEQFNNSMVIRLYHSDKGIEGYNLVFDSKSKYNGISQVRIFERVKN